jgi:hypothetical protein
MPAMNPAVEQAVVRRLQKPAPFTDEDLAGWSCSPYYGRPASTA